ncbi:MAG: type II toxin-antitoxin system YafQ family toxin [Patescibacteria group bacterium]
MKIFFTAHFRRAYKQHCKKNPQLKTKIERQINFFRKNILHPSLRVHKLKGKRSDQMAFWIENNLRIAYIKDDSDFILTDIITHDEY